MSETAKGTAKRLSDGSKENEMSVRGFQRSPLGFFRLARKSIGFVFVFAAFAGSASALPPPTTPEIDPGSMASALTLLAGGVLLLTDRFRRK